MRKIVLVLAVVGALAVAVPAAAQEDHTSCQGWGMDEVAPFAQSGEVGGFVSGIATGGAGDVADAVAMEHELFCAGS